MVRHHLYSIAHDLTQAWAFSREAQQRATQSPELLLDLHDNDASETFFAHIENAVVHTSGAVVALADTEPTLWDRYGAALAIDHMATGVRRRSTVRHALHQFRYSWASATHGIKHSLPDMRMMGILLPSARS